MFLSMALLLAGLGASGVSGQNANIIASNLSKSMTSYETSNYEAVIATFNFPDYYAPLGGQVNLSCTYEKNGRYYTLDSFVVLNFLYDNGDCSVTFSTNGFEEECNYLLGVKTYHGNTLVDTYSPAYLSPYGLDLSDPPLYLGNVASTNFKIEMYFYYLDVVVNDVSDYQQEIINSYNAGYGEGYTNGQEAGDTAGYIRGYAEGTEAVQDLNSTAGMIVSGIINVGLLPVNIFLSILDFEVFGINVGALVGSLLTIAVFMILWRIIKGTANSDNSGGSK